MIRADSRQSTSVRVVIAEIGLILLLGQGAFAQERSPAPQRAGQAGVTIEQVIVTGSNIPTSEEVGPNPVLTIDRDFIEKSGYRTAEELIRNLTVAGPNGVPTSNNAGSPTAGASSISLRGFDPSDTLTLIDGRRVTTYPVGAGAVANQTFVDLNSIPRAAIASIEILKDSASTTYGADAVAGVVNIKLRHDYRGAETSVDYGNTLDKDSSEFSASLLFGTGDANTNVTGVLNFYHRNSIFTRDRGYSSSTPFPSGNASPANLELSRAAVIAAGGNPPASLGDTFNGRAPFFTNGTAPASQYTYTKFLVFDFNFNAFAGSLPDSERYGGFVNADHKIFGDQMLLYADMFYQNVKTHSELAPAATNFFTTPGVTPLAIPPHAPGATLGGPSYAETGVSFGAFNPFNPFQQIISGLSAARLAEFGNRLFDNETDAFFSTIGLKGEKLFGGSWGYDASFRYSQIKNILRGTNLVSASRLNRILNAADPIFDPTSAQFIGTTVPYNPFGDCRIPIATNALPVAFASIHPRDLNVSKLATLDLNIYTTSLFQLPAGGFGLAFGGQFRRENVQQNPDDSLVTGDVLGEAPGFTTHAGRKTYAFYAEADLPVFSPTFSVPGLHALEFTAAVRFEEFLSNDTNVLVPKFGMRWQPFDESLTVRATWGEGFHEPSLIELFGTPIQFFSEEFDPVTETFVSAIPTILRSNPNLQPEDSRSFSGGIVYTPKFVPGLTLTVDLFDIESKGRVIEPFFGVIDRAFAGQSLPGERVNRDANGNIISIETAFENGGSQKARGIDFSLQYQTETRFGTFTSLTQASFLDSFQFSRLPDAPERERRSGRSLGSDEGYLKWKGNFRLDWAWHGLDVGMTVHYLDGFHEIVNFGPNFPNGIKEHYVKQTWFFDVQGSYDFSLVAAVETKPIAGYSKDAKESTRTQGSTPAKTAAAQTANFGLPIWKRMLNGTTITFGCNNIFGHDPPDANTNTNYPGFTYDSTGRFVYVSLTKKF